MPFRLPHQRNPKQSTAPSPQPIPAAATASRRAPVTAPPTPKRTRPLTFFDLPPQIRHRIYTHLTHHTLKATREVGGGSTLISGQREWHNRLIASITSPPLSLLHTSRQTRSEYASVLASTGIINISIQRSSWEDTPFVPLRLPTIQVHEIICNGSIDSCFRAGLVVNKGDFGARVRVLTQLLRHEWERGSRWRTATVHLMHVVGIKEIVDTRLWDKVVLRERLEGVKNAFGGISLQVNDGRSGGGEIRVIVHLFVEVPQGAESCGRAIAWFALDGGGTELRLVGWRYSYLEALDARRAEGIRALDSLARAGG
ncbi:hypothetical protein MBLNU457_3109t1 [Dothideomycetes sp. NU457]